jgi:Rrf2 family protein
MVRAVDWDNHSYQRNITEMLSLSKQADYAFLALTTLARREHAGGATAVPAKEIAELYGIPIEFLAKVLQKLARAHVVTSTFGPTGGYRLARPSSTITVGEIIAIVDGGVALTQCMKDEPLNACEHTLRCSIRGPLTRINEEIICVLNALTLDAITEDPDMPLVQISLGVPHRADRAVALAGESR